MNLQGTLDLCGGIGYDNYEKRCKHIYFGIERGNMEIKRDIYLDLLIRREKNGLIKIVTGVRRCGKSYLLFNLFHNNLLDKGVKEGHIIEIALDDRSNKELRDPDNMLKWKNWTLRSL